MSFKRLETDDFVVSADSITAGLFTDSQIPEITTFFTSSTQANEVVSRHPPHALLWFCAVVSRHRAVSSWRIDVPDRCVVAPSCRDRHVVARQRVDAPLYCAVGARHVVGVRCHARPERRERRPRRRSRQTTATTARHRPWCTGRARRWAPAARR